MYIYLSIPGNLGSETWGFGVSVFLGVSEGNFEVLRLRIVENSPESGFQGFPLGPGGRNASS